MAPPFEWGGTCQGKYRSRQPPRRHMIEDESRSGEVAQRLGDPLATVLATQSGTSVRGEASLSARTDPPRAAAKRKPDRAERLRDFPFSDAPGRRPRARHRVHHIDSSGNAGRCDNRGGRLGGKYRSSARGSRAFRCRRCLQQIRAKLARWSHNMYSTA